MFYIYILYSEQYNKYYVGYTDCPDRRLQEHNALSDGKYTTKYRPWSLVRSFPVGKSRGLARRIENHIKRQKSRVYIETLIQMDTLDNLIKLYRGIG